MEKKNNKNIIGIIVLTAIGLICFLSLVSYHADDIPFYSTETVYPPHNWIGQFGAWLSFFLFLCLGYSAFLVPISLFAWIIVMLVSTLTARPMLRVVGAVFLIILVSVWLALWPAAEPGAGISSANITRGGIVGTVISNLLLRYLGKGGAHIVVLTGMLLASFLAAGHYVVVLFENLFLLCKYLRPKLKAINWSLLRPSRLFSPKQKQTQLRIKSTVRPQKEQGFKQRAFFSADQGVLNKLTQTVKGFKKETEEQDRSPEIKIITAPQKKETREEKKERKRLEKEQHRAVDNVTGQVPDAALEYKLPGIDLLDSPPPIEQRKIEEDLQASARRLEETLKDFNIECKVDRVESGPVVTRYELMPAPGVKVHRITALSDDIALVMKAHSVRIVAPIPGKAAVGVEIPNSVSSLVYLREILESGEFYKSDFNLPLILGKDISGKPIIADLGDMPHLLIAGTTGSGKTVCVNSLIASLLFRLSPDEVKFIMVDPKMVELAVFNGLPHLLCPVVTDAKKVSGALAWVVNEMERRYQLFAKVGVRNISGYNKQYSKNEFAGMSNMSVKDSEEDFSDEEAPEKKQPRGRLPYIVVMIDELADLMIVASAEIETAITRLAQLSRAVGIHIVLATQRPSVDVITGVIKANFPARISFQVASKVDSRTVLDMNGAEKLLGKGDMLFLKPGTSKPIRAQGTLISDEELGKMVEFIKTQRQAEYNQQVLEHQKKKSTLIAGAEKDELFDDAVKVVLESGQASVSILQRRMRLGYTRAARLIDQMEAEGIVGSYQGSKPREILVERPDNKEPI